jgi:hypothetical protein
MKTEIAAATAANTVKISINQTMSMTTFWKVVFCCFL